MSYFLQKVPSSSPTNILQLITIPLVWLQMTVRHIYLNKSLKHVSQWQEGNEAVVLVGENYFLQDTQEAQSNELKMLFWHSNSDFQEFVWTRKWTRCNQAN